MLKLVQGPSGAQPSETCEFSWYADGSVEKMHQSPLYNFYGDCYEHDIISHPQIISMLYLTTFYNPNFKLLFEAYHQAFTKAEIEGINPANIPTFFQENDNNYNYTPENPGFRVLITTKWNNIFYTALDKAYPKNSELKFVSISLQRNINHRVRLYKRENYYLVVTSEWTWDMARKLVALLPKLFPNLGEKIPEKNMEIYRLFGTERADDWAKLYENFLVDINFKLNQNLKAMQILLTAPKSRQIVKLNKDLQALDNKIRDYLAYLQNYYRTQISKQKELYSLEHTTETVDPIELLNYLNANKSIIKTDVVSPYLYLTIQTPLIYYEQDFFKTMCTNPNTWINTMPLKYKEVLQATFTAEPKFELWTQTGVAVNMENNSCAAWNSIEPTLIVQPHIMHYNCWGNNAPLIIKSLSKQCYMEAIEQIIAATKNINWCDSIVSKNLIEDIKNFTDRATFKDLETNKFITIKEAALKLRKENSDEVHSNEQGTTNIDPAAI